MTVIELPQRAPTDQETPEGFSSLEVCAIAEISYRQCDYWDRAGIVKPSIRPARRSGSRRRYSDTDVLRVCVVAALVRAGVGLASIREHLDTILEHGEVLTGDVTITVGVERLRTRIEQYRRAAS